MKKAVHFGAGLIGEGFIGELLHDSGYEIVFADVVDDVIDDLNKNKSYYIFDINNNYQPKLIDHVSGISTIKEPEKVIDEIKEADILTTSVMASNLDKVAPLIAKGIKVRDEGNILPVLACENAILGSDMLKDEVLKTGLINQEELDKKAKFVNTAVDRMVFHANHEGKNGIDAGKDFELAVEEEKLPDHPIIGAEYVDDIKKYLERKIYIINCGHAVASYLGKQKGYETLQQVLNDPELLEEVREAMTESAQALEKKYGFNLDDLKDYMQVMMIDRWTLPGVKDEISRIAREPIRKISKEDRILGPALEAEKFGLDNSKLLKAIAYALHYYDENDPQSVELKEKIDQDGIEEAITTYTDLQPDDRMFKEILKYYNEVES